MISNIPWIISRRRKLIAIMVDSLISSSLYNFIFNSEFDTYPNRVVTTSFVIFWVIMSYILGRYSSVAQLSFIYILKDLFKTFILIILCNLIYLSINWGYPLLFLWNSTSFYNIELRELSNFFIRITLYLASISFIFQYSFNLLTNNIIYQKKGWIFYGSKEKFDQVLSEVSFNKKKIILTWLSHIDNLESIPIKNIKGIIIEEFSIISKNNVDIIFKLKLKGLKVESLLTWFENELHRIPTHILDNKFQLIDRLKPLEDNYQIRAKRIGDVFVCFILIFITSPLAILISILIFIEDQGPLFYSQVRTGINGERINIVKFRSMKTNAEKEGIQWSQKRDQRITKVGKLIRATRLDELPQLLCVLEGRMSLIGPRPERPEIESKLLNELPYYNYRYVIKPGISGWAQVNYPYGASISDTKIKLSFDIYYIKHFSILLDIFILFKTIKLVLNAKGSNPIK